MKKRFFSTSLSNVLYQLQLLKTNKSFMSKNNQFIYSLADTHFICLRTVQNYKYLDSISLRLILWRNIWLCTKTYVTTKYNHIITKTYLIYHSYIFFLKDKTQNTSIKIWNYVRQLCTEMSDKILNIITIHLDLEIDGHKKVLSVFPNVKLMAYRFDLGQYWWRKLNIFM